MESWEHAIYYLSVFYYCVIASCIMKTVGSNCELRELDSFLMHDCY
jgi:hypothetical protein